MIEVSEKNTLKTMKGSTKIALKIYKWQFIVARLQFMVNIISSILPVKTLQTLKCSTSNVNIEWTLVLPHPPSQNIRILQELEHVCITAQNRFLSGILTIINFGKVTRDQDTKPRRKNSFSLKLTNSLDSDLSPESD